MGVPLGIGKVFFRIPRERTPEPEKVQMVAPAALLTSMSSVVKPLVALVVKSTAPASLVTVQTLSLPHMSVCWATQLSVIAVLATREGSIGIFVGAASTHGSVLAFSAAELRPNTIDARLREGGVSGT